MVIYFIAIFLILFLLWMFKSKERAAQPQRSRRDFFHLLEEGVLLLNKDNEGVDCNRSFCRILGCKSSEIVGIDFFSVTSSSRGEILEKCKHLLKRIDTSPFELRETLLHNGEHESFSVDIIVAKVSEEERVLILKDTHQDYQTLKMGKDFIANASHELRTPITIIKGFIETLQDLPEVSDAMLEDIFEKVLRNCKRMDEIVKNLLILTDLDHLLKLNMQSVDLLALLDNCRHSLLEIYPEAKVEIFSADKGKITEADPNLLELAVMNLLQNAVKYSPAPAKIEIKLRETSQESFISIIDHGYGISEENRPHIFNRFYSVNKTMSRKLGGAGLGLSIVKNIIEKHQGEVTLESNPVGGMIFTLSLPHR